jgi:hypothetical protein
MPFVIFLIGCVAFVACCCIKKKSGRRSNTALIIPMSLRTRERAQDAEVPTIQATVKNDPPTYNELYASSSASSDNKDGTKATNQSDNNHQSITVATASSDVERTLMSPEPPPYFIQPLAIRVASPDNSSDRSNSVVEPYLSSARRVQQLVQQVQQQRSTSTNNNNKNENNINDDDN